MVGKDSWNWAYLGWQAMLVVAIFIALLSLAGCADEDVNLPDAKQAANLVAFSTYLQQNRETRATLPDGETGPTDTETLKQRGFGVFAIHTGAETFSHDGTTGGQPFDFMWNQEVTWDSQLADDYITKWTYAPLKYWPNGNSPADDQDDDTGSDPATGTGADGGSPDRVSFFAYAPWVAYSDLYDGDGTLKTVATDYGIVDMTGNGTASGTSCLTYRLNPSMKSSDCVDLLWAYSADRYKTDGQPDGGGYTTGTVQLKFIHALSRLRLLVQAVVDRAQPSDAWTEYDDDVHEATRVLIESVEIVSPHFNTEGQMLITPQSSGATVPTWQNLSSPVGLSISGSTIREPLRFTGSTSVGWERVPAAIAGSYDSADDAEADFLLLPPGVTKTPQSLFADDDDQYRLVLPGNAEEQLTVRIVYYVVTYDPRLTLNTPRYFSIVRNEITQSAAQSVKFEPNKQYTLRLLLGLTTVKFLVESVEGWDDVEPAEEINIDELNTP